MKTLKAILIFCLAAPVLATQIGGGCNYSDSSEKESVPTDARLVGEGDGPLTYLPRMDGRMYAYDVEDREVIDNRAIERQQQYKFLPDENRITVNGENVSSHDIKRKHSHRLYFLPTDRREWDRGKNDSRLPRDATRVADGHGVVSYTARDDGRVYVYDEDDDRVVADYRIRDGQKITIDPDKDAITIAGKPVYQGNLEKKHTHRIYFDRSSK